MQRTNMPSHKYAGPPRWHYLYSVSLLQLPIQQCVCATIYNGWCDHTEGMESGKQETNDDNRLFNRSEEKRAVFKKGENA